MVDLWETELAAADLNEQWKPTKTETELHHQNLHEEK